MAVLAVLECPPAESGDQAVRAARVVQQVRAVAGARVALARVVLGQPVRPPLRAAPAAARQREPVEQVRQAQLRRQAEMPLRLPAMEALQPTLPATAAAAAHRPTAALLPARPTVARRLAMARSGQPERPAVLAASATAVLAERVATAAPIPSMRERSICPTPCPERRNPLQASW